MALTLSVLDQAPIPDGSSAADAAIAWCSRISSGSAWGGTSAAREAAVSGGTWSTKRIDPYVVTTPPVSKRSLTARRGPAPVGSIVPNHSTEA